jgi:hypothetical protein
MSKEVMNLIERLSDEADLCRNEGANDIAVLLDEAAKALYQPKQEPLEYWNAVEGWVKIDEVREHFDSVGCGTIYKTAGEGRVPLTAAHRPDVDAMIALVRADEREACAKVCDDMVLYTGYDCAAAIRARGNT